MSGSLPPRPTVEHLKKEAKAIMRAHRARDAAALPALRRLRRFAQATDAEIFTAKIALHEAQFALAMLYGFESWDKLMRRVEASAPPLRQVPPARWFHGSTHTMDHLRAGSTVTPVVELARAFAHRPQHVDMKIRENDGKNVRRVEITHDGQSDGYLYEVEISAPDEQLRAHPESTMAPGDEMLTTCALPVRLLEAVSSADSRHQVYEEPLHKESAASDTDDFIRELLTKEVSEIAEGTVQITAIARAPGKFVKIALASANPGINPVDACVGPNETRLQRIVSQLGGEKVHLVNRHPSLVRFIENAVRPAAVRLVFFDEARHRAVLVMDPDQVQAAREHDGQLIRLASALVGWDLDVTPYVTNAN